MATPSSAGSGRSSLTSNRGCIESDLHLLPVSCPVKMIYGQKKKRGQTRKVKKKSFPEKNKRTKKKNPPCAVSGAEISICAGNTGHSLRSFYFSGITLCLSFYLFCHFFVTKRKVGLTKNNELGMFTGGGASGKHPAAACRAFSETLPPRLCRTEPPASVQDQFPPPPDRPTPPTGALTKCADPAPPLSTLQAQRTIFISARTVFPACKAAVTCSAKPLGG